jgi:hypothetical protein
VLAIARIAHGKHWNRSSNARKLGAPRIGYQGGAPDVHELYAVTSFRSVPTTRFSYSVSATFVVVTYLRRLQARECLPRRPKRGVIPRRSVAPAAIDAICNVERHRDMLLGAVLARARLRLRASLRAAACAARWGGRHWASRTEVAQAEATQPRIVSRFG